MRLVSAAAARREGARRRVKSKDVVDAGVNVAALHTFFHGALALHELLATAQSLPHDSAHGAAGD